MNNSITPDQIRKNNQKLIYQYIYEQHKVSQQDICMALHLSRPTVATNLSQLEADGLVMKGGQISTSSAGRKATAYCITAEYRISLGVEITRKEVKMMALNLYGERIDRVVFKIPFENTESYFQTVCINVLSFVNKLQFTSEQILGICFAMQGLISTDGQTVVYGKILDCTGLSIDIFEKYLPYRCRFIHDSESAAMAEVFCDRDLKDGFFINLSRHIGAALIRDRVPEPGMHGHNATFEHITLPHYGENLPKKKCYCGKFGCIDTYCSLHELLREDEDLDLFFEKKKNGDTQVLQRWSTFLRHLGEAVNLVHLVCDTPFILGGYLAAYMDETDLEVLYQRISELTPFEEEHNFLQLGKMPKHSITIGGALTYIQEFLKLEEL
ncbi:MAG: ROK family transcriptional regulator [Eubacteriales bacterium]|nr:ROK family transcriptional regulator [Eubacteriales bacterium]